jgi:hypothetical protein
MLKQMWEKLDTFTISAADGSERDINVCNEWGGFSRRLKMPVFTGWQDLVSSEAGQMKVLVSDRSWSNTAGVNNQERWVGHAIEHDVEAAFFVIKAVDPTGSPRKVEWLDDSRVFCGKAVREGGSSYVVATRQVQL